METKEIEKLVSDGFKGLEGQVDSKLNNHFEKHKEQMSEYIKGLGLTSKEEVEKAVKDATDAMEAMLLEVKKSTLAKADAAKPKSLEQILFEGMTEKKDALLGVMNGNKSASIMLTKANEDLDPANWANGSLTIATQDRSRGLYENPFAPVWFRNLLPQGTTTGGTIQYIIENGNVGAAGVWDGSGPIGDLTNKPGTAPLFDSVTKSVIWIAGITRVKREMLDDIAWLQGYLARRLTTGRTGLWVAENTQIYNALVASSVAYDGTKTIPVEIIYDAAFGQLRDSYHVPTTILMNSRDVVSLIALNKATTSGEYDLPPGTVAMVNGQLTIGGVPVIGAPNVPAGEFMVFDRSATEFITRMSPEVRFFEEDRDNVPKNLITVRAEERILPVVYDANAVIAGSFATT